MKSNLCQSHQHFMEDQWPPLSCSISEVKGRLFAKRNTGDKLKSNLCQSHQNFVEDQWPPLSSFISQVKGRLFVEKSSNWNPTCATATSTLWRTSGTTSGLHSLVLSLRWKVDYLLRRVVIEIQPVPQPPALYGQPTSGLHSLVLSLRWKVDYLLRRVVIEIQPVPQPPALYGQPTSGPQRWQWQWWPVAGRLPVFVVVDAGDWSANSVDGLRGSPEERGGCRPGRRGTNHTATRH